MTAHIHFYINRDLARNLGIRLSRWKRWSREFLPPDPLGGLQSGFARQYSPEEAFKVYMGGHLVAGLGFSIPQTKTVLADLADWVSRQYFSHGQLRKQIQGSREARDYRIFIFMPPHSGRSGRQRHYLLRELVSTCQVPLDGARRVSEHYLEQRLSVAESPWDDPTVLPHWIAAKILYITEIYRLFVGGLKGHESGA